MISTSHPSGKDDKKILRASLVTSIGLPDIDPDLSTTNINLIGENPRMFSMTSSETVPLVTGRGPVAKLG